MVEPPCWTVEEALHMRCGRLSVAIPRGATRVSGSRDKQNRFTVLSFTLRRWRKESTGATACAALQARCVICRRSNACRRRLRFAVVKSRKAISLRLGDK
jgi:hypothetical protein